MQKLNLNHRLINDKIHGYIHISNYANLIIDHPYFQRMRFIKQLGTCSYVFLNATHSRFEHSIGTYYLANKLLDCIRLRTDKKKLHGWLMSVPQIKIYYDKKKEKLIKPPSCVMDDYLCELVKISALCHDLGHGPFSHAFDDVFLKDCEDADMFRHHEERSCIILEKIIKSNETLKSVIDDNEIEFMKSLINPSKSENGFIYQIVANHLNGIDVDKCDYIQRDTYSLGLSYSFDHSRLLEDIRVIDNKICYPRQIYYEIMCLFSTRYRLHKQVYCHKAVISIEYMILDILNNLDPILKLKDATKDMDKFCRLTDGTATTVLTYIKDNIDSYPVEYHTNINNAYELLQRIEYRNIYKFIGTIITLQKVNITIDDFIKINKKIQKDEIVIHTLKIGYITSLDGNFFDNVYFYDGKQIGKKEECFCIKKENVSTIVPNVFQEYIVMVFVKNQERYEIVKNTFETIKNILDKK